MRVTDSWTLAGSKVRMGEATIKELGDWRERRRELKASKKPLVWREKETQ